MDEMSRRIQVMFKVIGFLACSDMVAKAIIFEIPRLCQMYTSPPEGLPPYMAYTGMRRWTGYGFRPLCPIQGI